MSTSASNALYTRLMVISYISYLHVHRVRTSLPVAIAIAISPFLLFHWVLIAVCAHKLSRGRRRRKRDTNEELSCDFNMVKNC